MKFEINLNKTRAFSFIALFVIIVGAVLGYAYGTNNPGYFGHTAGELELPAFLVDSDNNGRIDNADYATTAGSVTSVNWANIIGIPVYLVNKDLNGNGIIDRADNATNALNLGGIDVSLFCRKDGTNCPAGSGGIITNFDGLAVINDAILNGYKRIVQTPSVSYQVAVGYADSAGSALNAQALDGIDSSGFCKVNDPNCKGPKGDKGDTGATGATGSAGNCYISTSNSRWVTITDSSNNGHAECASDEVMTAFGRNQDENGNFNNLWRIRCSKLVCN